jgi:hypothetical protein
LLLAFCAAGCGEDNLQGPIQQFVGSWRYSETEATGTLTCGLSSIPEVPRGNKTLATGVAGGIVDLTASDLDPAIFCDFVFDVAGPVATARVDQACALTGGNDVISFDQTTSDAHPDPDLWTFKLLSATTAEEIARTTITVYQPAANIGDAPTTVACYYTMTAHLTRVSKD